MSNMPDEIWVVGKSADKHNEHEDLFCLWSHKPSWTECTKFVRADLYEAVKAEAEALYQNCKSMEETNRVLLDRLGDKE